MMLPLPPVRGCAWLLLVVGLGLAVAGCESVRLPDNFLQANSAPMYRSVRHPQPPNPSLWGSVKTPLPTNTWWLNLVLDMGEGVIAPLPFHMKARQQGMVLCFPWVDVSPTVINPPFIDNVVVQMSERAKSRKVVGYDDLSATMEWRKVGGGGSMTVPIVRGAPYASFILDNITPLISSVHAIVAFENSDNTRTRFELKLNNGQKWLVYSSKEIFLEFGNVHELRATMPYTGVLRLAIVPPGEREILTDLTPNESFEPWLDENRDQFPTGGNVVLSSDGDRSLLEFQFHTSSMGVRGGNLLMMAMPHHLDTQLQGAGMGNVYRTTYGFLTGVLGTTWDLGDTMNSIGWDAPHPINPSRLSSIRVALIQDVENALIDAQDPYFFGKQLSKLARLALIADQLGETSLALECRTKIKKAYEPWLMANNQDAFVFDQDWGGLVPTQGLMDIGRDFGAGWYNDHHFHQGYHLYAAAVVGKEDIMFLQEYKSQLLNFVRNFANPNRNDVSFTFARHKDFYVGHSWASGIIPNFGERANQESSSEAINAYYAVQLLGKALGNVQLEDFGRLLLHTELKSAIKYWQITSFDDVYPEPFATNKIVGIRWATKVDYTTFFGANIEFIFGIQFIPFTPISELYLRSLWMREAYPKLSLALSNPDLGSGWRGLIYMAHAILNPQEAWIEITTQLDEPYDNGNSKTNALYWVATRGLPQEVPIQTPDVSMPVPKSPMPSTIWTNREKELIEFAVKSTLHIIGGLQVDFDKIEDEIRIREMRKDMEMFDLTPYSTDLSAMITYNEKD